MKALKKSRHRLILSGKSEAWAKTQTRCQDVCSTFYLSSNNFYGIFIYSEIRSSLLATTEVPLHSQSVRAPESQDGASQGAAHHPVHSRSWHLPNHQETKKNRTALSGYGDFFWGHPSCSQNSPSAPNSCWGGVGGGPLCPFSFLSLFVSY